MYAKLFGKILDSSIWLEDPEIRIVWFTLLAAKDKTGYAHFSAIENLALRARISVEKTNEAIKKFESPDPNSSDQEFEGRRVERVPGGWIVLNAEKYDKIARLEHEREATRMRVKKWRDKNSNNNSGVTECNDSVQKSNGTIKITTAVSSTIAEKEKDLSESKLPDVILYLLEFYKKVTGQSIHLYTKEAKERPKKALKDIPMEVIKEVIVYKDWDCKKKQNNNERFNGRKYLTPKYLFDPKKIQEYCHQLDTEDPEIKEVIKDCVLRIDKKLEENNAKKTV